MKVEEKEDTSPRYVAAYKRNALNVIENVAVASDLEKHWIQNNPVILYDVELVQEAIELYDKHMIATYGDKLGVKKSLFTKDALSPLGYEKKGVSLRLLCDDDIICWLKNKQSDSEISKQFFNRSIRLKPLWKSDIEFRLWERKVIENNINHDINREKVLYSFKKELRALADNTFFINEEALESAQEKKKSLEDKASKSSDNLLDKYDEDIVKTSLPAQENELRVLSLFKKFVHDKDLDNFEFACIFKKDNFESNYAKMEQSDIKIAFSPRLIVPLKDILTVRAVKPDEDKALKLIESGAETLNLGTEIINSRFKAFISVDSALKSNEEVDVEAFKSIAEADVRAFKARVEAFELSVKALELSVKALELNEREGYYFLYTTEQNFDKLSQDGKKDPAEEIMQYISDHWEVSPT